MKSKDQQLLEEAYDNINKGTGVTEETAAKYYAMMGKLERNEISEQQWQDFCMVVLGDIMEANKDVFIRLKHR